jgi:purine-binding chemotaxis protein CheW
MTLPTQETTNQLCTFLLDGVLFGIDVRFVQEVLRLQEMTPVPLAPAVITGLINLRGHIVTAIDLRIRLELGPRPATMEPVNVVVRHGDSTVSLLVDDIGDVVTVDPSSFEAVPSTLDARIKAVVRGVYKLKGELLLLMDPGLTLQLDASRDGLSRRHA